MYIHNQEWIKMEKLLQIKQDVTSLTQLVIDTINEGVERGVYEEVEEEDNNLVMQMKSNIAVSCIMQLIYTIELAVGHDMKKLSGKDVIEVINVVAFEIFDSVMIIEE